MTKQSDSDSSVMLELWGMQSTLLLPSMPGQLWPGMVATERVQIDLKFVLMLNWND